MFIQDNSNLIGNLKYLIRIFTELVSLSVNIKNCIRSSLENFGTKFENLTVQNWNIESRGKIHFAIAQFGRKLPEPNPFLRNLDIFGTTT